MKLRSLDRWIEIKRTRSRLSGFRARLMWPRERHSSCGAPLKRLKRALQKSHERRLEYRRIEMAEIAAAKKLQQPIFKPKTAIRG